MKVSVTVTIDMDDMPRKRDSKRGGMVADLDSALATIHCGREKETILNMQRSRVVFDFPIGVHLYVVTKPK